MPFSPQRKKNRTFVKSINDTGDELPWHRAIDGMVRVTWSRDLSLIRHCSNINPCRNVDFFLGFVASRNGVFMLVFDQSHLMKCKFLSPLFSLGLQVNLDLSILWKILMDGSNYPCINAFNTKTGSSILLLLCLCKYMYIITVLHDCWKEHIVIMF